jgi:hypothetical protein
MRKNRKMSEETKKKISFSMTANKNPFYGKVHSDHEKKMISESMRKYWETIPKDDSKK